MVDLFNRFDFASATLSIMTLIIVGVVWSWHRDKASAFDLKQVLLDNVSNKISIEKVGYMTALAVSSWGVVALIQRDKLSEWFFGLFIGSFVLGRIASGGISVYKDIKGKNTYQSTTTIVENQKTTVD